MARLVDFEYTVHDQPVRIGGVVNLVIGMATFCIEGEGDDYEERSGDFWDALEEFKEAIPGRQRVWDEDEKLWTVKVTRAVKEALFDIFANAVGAFEDAERQLSLW